MTAMTGGTTRIHIHEGLPSPDEISRLAEPGGNECVSIFARPKRAGRGVELHKNKLDFREAVSTADALLKKRGHDESSAREITERARSLLEEEAFWLRPPQGYCLFASSDRADVYRLPAPPAAVVEVAGRCHIKPLLPLHDDRGAYHLLALQRERVRLFRADRWSIEEVALEGVPASMQEALGFDRPAQEHQFHTGTAAGGAAPGGGGRRPAVHHGQGGGKDDRHAELLRFYQVFDRALRAILGDGGIPLVVAGSERAVPVYREACSRRDLLAGEVLVNPEDLAPEDLRDRAWEAVRGWMHRERLQARKDYARMTGTGTTSDDVLEVVRAARTGRVRSVLVSLEDTVRGRCDGDGPEDCALEQNGGGEDLLNLVAAETLAHGGDAHAVPHAELPGRTAVAAVLRW